MTDVGPQVAVGVDVKDVVDSATVAFQEAIDVAVEQVKATNPTLADDYAERDRLLAERKTNAEQLSAVLQRIAQKEGPEIRSARLRQHIMSMPEEQLRRFGGIR